MKRMERMMMMLKRMMEVFVSSREEAAGALPQSPDVQPSRRGTYMHVEQVRSYVWTYNRLVVHTHTHPGQCACGIGTNYVLTTVSTYCSVHMPHTPACVYEHQSHRTHSQP